MSHKVFDNKLVERRKSKLALKLNKPAYIRMFILELCKVLMCEFHYDYIKNMTTNQNYYSQRLIVSRMKLKQMMCTKILAAIKKCLILVIIRLSQNAMITQTNY